MEDVGRRNSLNSLEGKEKPAREVVGRRGRTLSPQEKQATGPFLVMLCRSGLVSHARHNHITPPHLIYGFRVVRPGVERSLAPLNQGLAEWFDTMRILRNKLMDKSMGVRLVCRGITRRFESRILRNARDQGCFLWQRAAVNLAPCRGDTELHVEKCPPRAWLRILGKARPGFDAAAWGGGAAWRAR